MSIFSDIPQELFGSQTNTARVEESGRNAPLLISQGFSHGRRPESKGGGSEADDGSLRKIKTNKQRQLSNPIDWRLQKSAEKVDILSQSSSAVDDVEVTAEGMKVYAVTFK